MRSEDLGKLIGFHKCINEHFSLRLCTLCPDSPISGFPTEFATSACSGDQIKGFLKVNRLKGICEESH